MNRNTHKHTNKANGGDLMLSRNEKEKIWYLYENEQMSKSAIATKLGLSRNTVIKVLSSPLPYNEQLMSEIKEIQDKKNAELLELIKNDNRLPDTVNKILNAINSDEVINRVVKENNGLRNLMTVMGVLSDKHIAGKRVEQDERRLNIQERMADIKERELNARLENPDAFTNITIIDDSETASKWYQDKGTNEQYSKN